MPASLVGENPPPWPPNGVFPPGIGRRDDATATGLMSIRPVVVDANVIRDEVLFAARRGHQSALMAAAAGGGVRLFCGPHVPLEVEEHLDHWVTDKGEDSAPAWTAWRSHLLPVLRCADVPASLLGPVELARHGRLRFLDADELPTLVLAAVADLPVLTRDTDLVHAVYGPGTDPRSLAKYLDVALSTRQLTHDDAAATAVTLAGRLAVASGRGAVGLVGDLARRAPPPLVAFVAALVAANLLVRKDVIRERTSRAADTLRLVAADA